MKKMLKQYLFLVLSLAMVIGCGKEEIDPPDDIVSNYIGVAADGNPNLKVLVSYLDKGNTNATNNKLYGRLAVVDESFLEPTSLNYQPNYTFIGRAYSQDTPGDGFTAKIYEYYTPGSDGKKGYQYSIGMQCDFSFKGLQLPNGVFCPIDVSIRNHNPVFYSAAGSYPEEGIVPLYQYASAGGLGAGGNGNVSFTTDLGVIAGLQRMGVIVDQKDIRMVGFIYHATARDCSLRRSIYCNKRYRR